MKIGILSVCLLHVLFSETVNQSFEAFFDAFQNYFNDYPFVTLKTDPLLWDLDDHSLLPLSGKSLGVPKFLYEWKQQIWSNYRCSDK